MGTLKGQNFRICVFDHTETGDTPYDVYKVIGMATGCTVTETNNTEEASHKDIVGAAAMPTVTSMGWQISCDSLDVSDTAAMLTAIKSMAPLTLMWDETSTTDNQTRVKATFARKGQAYLSDCTFKPLCAMLLRWFMAAWNGTAIPANSGNSLKRPLYTPCFVLPLFVFFVSPRLFLNVVLLTMSLRRCA